MFVRDRKGIPELTKLRSGTNRLRIEKGRYEKLAVENRICRFCEADDVEDEKHFMLYCEPYEDLRQKLWTGLDTLFSYPVRTWSEEKKLKALLISDEVKMLPNYNEVTCDHLLKRAMAKRRAMEAWRK